MSGGSISLLGYEIYNDLLQNINFNVKNSIIINTINPHSYIVAEKDLVFKNALLNSDVLLADGIGIVLAGYILNRKKVIRNTGPDVFNYIIREVNNNKGNAFFLGSSLNTLSKITKRMNNEFPDITLDTFSPPYKDVFTIEENELMIEKINNFTPDVLFVGMTAPKQEKWVFENHEKIEAKVICSIGAVFDFYAGTVKMPHRVWSKLGLLWFVRFLKEPRKLWRRNFISMPLFLLKIAKELILRN